MELSRPAWEASGYAESRQYIKEASVSKTTEMKSMEERQAKSARIVSLGGTGGMYQPSGDHVAKTQEEIFPLMKKRYVKSMYPHRHVPGNTKRLNNEACPLHSEPKVINKDSCLLLQRQNTSPVLKCRRAEDRSASTKSASLSCRRLPPMTSSKPVPGRLFVSTAAVASLPNIPSGEPRSETRMSNLTSRPQTRASHVKTPANESSRSNMEDPVLKGGTLLVNYHSPAVGIHRNRVQDFWDRYDAQPELFTITFKDSDKLNCDIFYCVDDAKDKKQKASLIRPRTCHQPSVPTWQHKHFKGCLVGVGKTLHNRT